MIFYDYVRKEPDAEMVSTAEKLGVKLLYNINRVKIAKNLTEAKKYINMARAIFVPRVDEALLSLASQKKVFLGFFTSDVSLERMREYTEWVRVVSKSRVPIILATGARRATELRSGRDIARIGVLLGMRREDALSAVSQRWRVLVETL